MKFSIWLEAKIRSDRKNIEVTPSKHGYNITDTKTGGRALVSIDKHFNYEKAEFEGMELKIISWYAYPLYSVVEKDDYIGGGFARNVMIEIMKLAKHHNISILEIFAPSDYSSTVLNHYVSKGLLKPIPYTKMELGIEHTGFYIDPNKANEMVNSV